MKELYAGMLQFIPSVPQYVHSQRKKKTQNADFFGLFFSVLVPSKDMGKC